MEQDTQGTPADRSPGDEPIEIYWKALDDGLSEAHRELDKLIIALASGALGISLILIRDIAPHPEALWILAIAWTSLAAAVLATLISLIASSVAHEAAMNDLRASGQIQDAQPDRRSTKLTQFFARTAPIPLIIGIAFLITFALINLS